ncbi:MAG TPA: ABC transporter ATP-binding protein [Candidatus Limnocylindrales bacterium]|jgi:ABC-2 type transport system ATP-binding protein|nr:ABC transporter ATP-binding protein [Candidatus Limnocylindrales bacterium]
MSASAQPSPGSVGSPVEGPPIVDMRSVSRSFGEVHAVVDMTLSVRQGTILGVIGPSGSGKTTAIRVMTGAIRPDKGSVRVLGEEPRHFHRATRERIGYMPQQFVLYPDLTARENVDFIGAMFGMLRPRRVKRTEEVLRLVELWEARDRRVAHLSGGMQRRVALACALVHQPRLLILDEPTAGIDPILRQEIWEELRRLRDGGVTLLVTTQYVGEAEYCDTVALISAGELIAYDQPEEVRREALGGDVVQVGTTRAFDAATLPQIEGVTEIRQVGPRELLVISTNGAQALPDVVDAIVTAGAEVDWSREYRPSFDEVFAELVNRHQGRAIGAAGSLGMGATAFRLER